MKTTTEKLNHLYKLQNFVDCMSTKIANNVVLTDIEMGQLQDVSDELDDINNG